MIGLTFCKQVGQATAVEGSLMNATCAKCKNAPTPDPKIYGTRHVPFKLGRGKSVHAGLVRTGQEHLSLMKHMENLAWGSFTDEKLRKNVLHLIAQQRELVEQMLPEEAE